MEYILCYDLETTGLNYQKDEIVQFSGIVLNMQLEEVETINIFHATEVSEFILNLHGKTQEFYNNEGTDKATFVGKIVKLFKDYNFKYIMGHNIIGFDNKWLDVHANIKINDDKSIDTMKMEQKLLHCDDYGNVLDINTGAPTGEKVKRTLKESCIRRGVEFDEKEAHDGLYDCQKTLELYRKDLEICFILCFKLITTGPHYEKDEILQFSAIALNTELEKIDEINIFHATPVSESLLNLHDKTQDFYNEIGEDKATFINKIDQVFKKDKPIYLLGHNITGFDNKWLDYHTSIDTSKYKSVETINTEKKLLNCDGNGNLLDIEGNKKGEKVDLTLKESCLRRGINFDNVAHDGLYECEKTFELYKKYKEIRANGF